MTKSANRNASKEAREADVFMKTSEKFIRWMQKNKQLLLLAIGVVVAAVVGFNGLVWWKQQQELKAQNELFKIEKSYGKLHEKYETAKQDHEKALEEAVKAKKPAPAKSEAHPSGDLQKDYGDVVRQFEEVMKKHEGSNSATMASLHLARIYVDYEQYPLAEKILLVSAPKGKGLLKNLAQMMLGTVVEVQGRCDSAIKHWQEIKDVKSVLYPEVMLRQALCYETLSQADKAKELYKKIQAEHSESQVSRKAKSYLRLLELKGG